MKVAAVVSKSISMSSEESLTIATKAGFSGSDFATSMGVGLASAAINYAIQYQTQGQKDALFNASGNEAESMQNKNAVFLHNLLQNNKSKVLEAQEH